MNKFVGKSLISINKIHGGDVDTNGNVRIEIKDIDSNAHVSVTITTKDLMEAIMGLYEVPCSSVWKNTDLLGYVIETKDEMVEKDKLDEYIKDGWKMVWGYNNHHTSKQIDGKTFYKTSFQRHVKNF